MISVQFHPNESTLIVISTCKFYLPYLGRLWSTDSVLQNPNPWTPCRHKNDSYCLWPKSSDVVSGEQNRETTLKYRCAYPNPPTKWKKMKGVAAGAHLPKRPDDRANYCLGCSFLPQCKQRVFVFTVEWSGVRAMGEQWWGLAPTSIPSELGHLAVPINFFAKGKTRWPKWVSDPGSLGPVSYALPFRYTGSGQEAEDTVANHSVCCKPLCTLINFSMYDLARSKFIHPKLCVHKTHLNVCKCR